MRAYFDVEYLDQRKKKGLPFEGNVFLASIGIVREDGAELHFASSDLNFNEEMQQKCRWFYRNAYKKLKNVPKKPLAEIAIEVREFLQGVTLLVTREGGANNDKMLLEQLIGPHTIPICDIEIVWQGFGRPELPARGKKRHVALDDAHWHRAMFNHVLSPVLRAA